MEPALELPSEGPIGIISGGQTGVDRGALDAALKAGVPCGGWAPHGREAEDGVIPARYPLQELAQGGYRQRTRANVLASDGTVLIYFRRLHGGTELTLRFCITEKKPYLLLDGSELAVERAAVRIDDFVREHRIRRLNVAGPRASNVEGGQDYACAVVGAFLQSFRAGPPIPVAPYSRP